jgi:hypothetical protein
MKPNRSSLRSCCARRIAVRAAVFLALRCVCGAATFSLNPLADALVTTGTGGALSANNYGGAGALAIAASGLPKGTFQSVLQFDLAGARSSFDAQFGAGQWTLQSVTLQLTSAANNNPTFFNNTAAGQFGVSWLRNNSWLEGTGTPAAPTTDGITYDSLLSTFTDNANDQALGTFSFGGGSSGANSYLLALSSGLTAEVLTGDHLSLRLFAADSAVSYLVNSRSVGVSANRPALIINVVPEPRALALGPVGLAMFVLRRIHRARQT